VRRKIAILSQEVPELRRLMEMINNNPAIHIRYVDSTGYEKLLRSASLDPEEAREYVSKVG
jgi:hypothetical protein